MYKEDKKRVAIIGAGIAGLAAGYELKKAGFEVFVFEKEKTVGGRMETKKKGGFTFDTGADFFVNCYDLLYSYAKELNIPWEFSVEGGRHRIIRGGVAHYIDLSGPFDLLRWKLLSLRARVRFLWWVFTLKMIRGPLDFFHLSKNSSTLTTISAGEYLRTRISPEVADFIADPFTGIMNFHRVDEISAAALFSLMRMMTTDGGFRMCYTRGGMSAIPKALAKLLNVETGVTVTSVSSKGRSVEVVHGGVGELFDAVVVATTGNVAQRIVKPLPATAERMFSALRYSATMTVAFVIPANLFTDGTRLTYVPFVESKIVSGYDNQIKKSADMELRGHSLLLVYLYEHAIAELSKKDDEEFFAIVREEMRKVCPEVRHNPSVLQAHDLKCWAQAMPKFSPDYVGTVVAFEEQGQGENNIYLAGDYLNSVWTEGAARCGKRVAEMITSHPKSLDIRAS
ncbi:MAG: hypothetical protein COV10_00065 [Candidatus Vogelbacteria bacterium CG10_big_fil_rev_8_21_14_0_10_51_16]|uniref:Amine oxidase domain-containing protein n=1 Tax=Candidatus Vogelbacteria bacterium CG10_big_fil_rev_8_21_14_0_10_51_16 TaxID=1975045 RepID=A0A2H0RFH4_9BACT|nr:MAG: hypothetical protein COV10_00065 [Candidatus Vogelbacteria bacterium CG10_big_fil_rev_8_21_14_0_10_51_16]